MRGKKFLNEPTTGANASVCSPAAVVFSAIVPRGATSFSAVGRPVGEPVQSTTMSASLVAGNSDRRAV